MNHAVTPQKAQALKLVAQLSGASTQFYQLCLQILNGLDSGLEHPQVGSADAGAIPAFDGTNSLGELAELLDELARAIRAGELDRHVVRVSGHGGPYAK